MDIMSLIIWIVVGAFAGWVASIIMKTNAEMGAIANIVVGVIGAFIGGWIVSLFGTAPEAGQLNIASILTAILGAIVLLIIVKALRK